MYNHKILYNRDVLESKEEVYNDDNCPTIKEDLKNIPMNMKDEESTWIPAELLKNLGEDMNNLLHEIIIKSYETGDIPEEFVKMPKKK